MSLDQELFRCKFAVTNAFADGRFAFSGAAPHYAPDRTFDIEHLKLELVLDFSRKSLTGICTASLKAFTDQAQTMIFDAVDFKQLQVSARGRPVRHDYTGRQIKIHWDKPFRRGETIEIKIHYRVAEPKLGLFFVGPDQHYPKKPVQAWTQGEDEYNRFWFPCHDAPQERMTSEVVITVPEKFTAISNGALLRQRRNPSRRTRTFHWKQNVPHPAYLLSLAVGEFAEIRDNWGKIPVLYFCPKGREEDAKRAFGKTPKMMDFFSRKLGVPYAYAKYSQVAAVDFIYGGMENISATTQTANTLHDERAHLDFSSDPLVAHELAHQWFGDLVTCKDWSHAWLNESFATYFEALFKEHDLGREEFEYELFENSQIYFNEDKDHYRRPMVTHTYKNTNDLFDRHLYEKGSVILHMLRGLLGDVLWWRSMNLYLTRHRAKGVETIDLINAIQDATGKNMRWFFDQWIFKAGHPEYKVRTWWDARTRKVFVRVLQAQSVNGETGLFTMPVTFAFHTAKGEKRFTEKIDKKDQQFSYELPAAPLLVLFDPDHGLLKKVDYVKPEAQWIYQLTHDPHILGRRDAAEALGQMASPSAVQALSQALFEEKFWGTASEIARALGRANSSPALEALLRGLDQLDHPKVRRAIFSALGQIRHPKAVAALRERYPSEKSYFAEAEALQSLGRLRDSASLPVLKETLKRESWNDILRTAALEGLTVLKASESVEILKKYSAYGHSPQARMAAIRGLAHLSNGREDIQQHLLRLLSDRFLLVQMAVVRALGQCADERATGALMKLTSGDLDGRLKRAAEEAIRKIRKGMEQEFPSNSSESAIKRVSK